MRVDVSWVEGMEFRSSADSGHSWNMDASVEAGGNNLGPRPTELLLSAIGGCTGIDIVSILQKMQQPLAGLRVEVSGERAEEHPRRFVHITLRYIVSGKGLTEDRVARAVQLSTEKYCSVLHSLNAKVDYSYEIVEE
ncbi:MAG: OsmC family protein [Firmicutes bacterium]|jgi:putative redox protein|nr:OsmC family protein [Bacillota bacterium]